MKAGELWSLPKHFPFRDFFDPDAKPWEWLPQIKQALGVFDFPEQDRSEVPSGLSITGDVFLSEDVKLPPYGSIQGPAWIGPECELRPGVYIRGNVIVGKGSVLGNSCEYKNCMLLDGVQTPHFNYVGDSILGNHAHLGAGVILSNLRLDQDIIKVMTTEGKVSTGLRKLGALMADDSEVGCNSSLQPGTIIGRKAVVFPNLPYSGTLAEGMMAASRPDIRVLRRM